MSNFAPYHLQILLHIYSTPTPVGEAFPDNAVLPIALRELSEDLLIELPSTGRYKITERGKAHIKQLLALPLPEPAWMGATGSLIK